MENVITLGKLIGCSFFFCLPLLYLLFLKTPKIRGMTSSPCNGNHFSSYVGRSVCRSVGMYVYRVQNA